MQSFSIQADAACDQVAECGSVFSSGALRHVRDREKLAVGDVTSHTSTANATTGVRSISDRLLMDFISYGWGAFLNSGEISYAFSNSARDSSSFPS